MYAIVDIETTGGHASANGITEIAIVIHDGKEIKSTFNSLINPERPIPVYIQALTGINDEMVSSAPGFAELAPQIYDLLKDKVFVAHNVNFDYSFIHYHLLSAGFQLQSKKLCTVRLSRKIIPGLISYSLGKLCSQVGIKITDRHRAMGDAFATAKLFSMLIEKDIEGHIEKTLNIRSKEQSLPPHLPKEDMEKLPAVPGIYYFHDKKSKVVYVGKAKDIRKRVRSHFANNKPGKQKQDFLRDIHHITFQECGTELMSFILEAVEIKRLWPAHNRSLKRFEHAYGLYAYEDQNRYIRLAIDKKTKFSKPYYTFNSILEGHNLLRNLVYNFNLCSKLCFIQRNNDSCISLDGQLCRGACEQSEGPVEYNSRVQEALDHLRMRLPEFLLIDNGRHYEEKSCILMEQGQFYGMGYIPNDVSDYSVNELKVYLTKYPANDYIRNLIMNHALQFPEKLRLHS
ncbi:exonuclease domain-containing protein [Daejeonella sp. H1SJ63]|uniref:exonuclease domain-containing protein n=1 Tax=Daejeonella sp. H1SJ63 TaxID=3034145 RepID=UPI0023EC0C89|nr:exonuclease domain-containing protein [Daejeonella sp. H1SJ63]